MRFILSFKKERSMSEYVSCGISILVSKQIVKHYHPEELLHFYPAFGRKSFVISKLLCIFAPKYYLYGKTDWKDT